MVTLFDVKQAAGRLYKDKKYTLVVLLSIAFGLAISLFLYAQVYTRALAELPFVDGDKIVYVSRYENNLQRLDGGLLNYDVNYLQQHQTTLDHLAIIENRTFAITTPSNTQQVTGVATTSSLFNIANEPALLGRTLLPADDQPNAAPVIVISYSLWKRLFQHDPNIVGQQIKVDGTTTTIVGVMKDGFRFPVNDEAWLSHNPTAYLPGQEFEGWLAFLAKLKPGVSVTQANEEFNNFAGKIAQDHPKTYLGKSIKVQKYTSARATPAKLIIQMMAAVAISVLLMSCFSVTSLVIVRMLSNIKEAAIKNAIGVPAINIMLLPLIESFLLYAVAGIIGLLLCALAIKFAAGFIFLPWDPFWWKPEFNSHLVVTGLAFVVIAWMITGLVPVLMATNKRFYNQLNSGKKGGASNQTGKLMNSVVAMQVACTLVLMIFTGIAFTSFYSVLKNDYGFDSKNFLVSYIRLPASNYAELKDRNHYYEKLAQEVGQIPGVQQVTFASARPGGGGYLSMINGTDVNLSSAGSYQHVIEIPIAENYFETLGRPILEGRSFNHTDNETTDQVVIVSAQLAKKLAPNGSAIGKKIHLNPDRSGPLLTVVGVATNLVYGTPLSFYRIPFDTIYRPAKQIMPVWDGMNLIVKTTVDPYQLSETLLNTARKIDPGVALREPTSMDDALSTNASRFQKLLYNFMPATLLAFILSALSIYAISARVMHQRTNDIGVMKALGLQNQQITQIFMRDTYIKLGAGLVLGALFSILILPGLVSQLVIVGYWSIAAIVVTVILSLSAIVVFASRIPLAGVHKLSPHEAINKI